MKVRLHSIALLNAWHFTHTSIGVYRNIYIYLHLHIHTHAWACVLPPSMLKIVAYRTLTFLNEYVQKQQLSNELDSSSLCTNKNRKQQYVFGWARFYIYMNSGSPHGLWLLWLSLLLSFYQCTNVSRIYLTCTRSYRRVERQLAFTIFGDRENLDLFYVDDLLVTRIVTIRRFCDFAEKHDGNFQNAAYFALLLSEQMSSSSNAVNNNCKQTRFCSAYALWIWISKYNVVVHSQAYRTLR